MGGEVSRESDIYSLGIVAFELITGQVPYSAQTPIAIVQKQIADPIPDITKLVDDVPDTTQEVIETALAKAPESRFPSAEALVVALRGALRALDESEASLTIAAAPTEHGEEALFKPTVEMPDGAVSEEDEKAPVRIEEEGASETIAEPPSVIVSPPEVDIDVERETGEKKPSFFSSSRNRIYIGVGGIIVVAAIVLSMQWRGSTPSVPEATQSSEPVQASPPGTDMSGEEYYEEAHSLMNQGRWSNAIEALDSALAAGYEHADVYGLRAYAKLNRGNLIPALDDFTRAVELNENIFEYWRDRGITKFELGDLDGALADITRGLEINSVDPEGFRARARVFNEVGGVVEAIEDALTATRLEPDNFENYVILLEVYRINESPPHQAEETMEMLDIAIELEPMNPDIRMLRGDIYWFEWGDEIKAQDEYNTAVEVSPQDYTSPYDRRGLFYSQIGRCDLTVEDYSHYIEIDTDNPYIYLGRGECYDQLGDADLARADFVQVMIKTTGVPEFADLRLRAQEWIDAHPE